MTEQIFSQTTAYRFIKVEEYFQQYRNWQTIGAATKTVFDATN